MLCYAHIMSYSILKGDLMYKILIVEDDHTIFESLCAFLKSWNYDVHSISD